MDDFTPYTPVSRETKRRIAIWVVALALSLGMHFRVYEVLLHMPPTTASTTKAPAPVEINFDINDPAAKAALKELARRELAQPQPMPEEPREQPKREEPAQKRAQAKQDAERRQAITQESDNPKVPKPKDARFIAQENRDVREETVARVTANDGKGNEASGQAKGEQGKPPGEEQQGKSVARHMASAEQEPSRSVSPTPSAPQQPQRSGGGAAQPAQPEIVVRDALGSFKVAVRPKAQNPSVLGPSSGQPSAQPGPGRTGRAGVQLPTNMNWSTLAAAYGSDELSNERQAYAEKRRKAGGGGFNHNVEWQKFRAAIENYVPNVKPGNQTALRAAASPFAAYLAEVHRQIHEQFADEFLPSLPLTGDLADENLVTKLEIVLDASGELKQVGVVGSSGNLVFDHGAYASVQRAAPYPPAPKAIVSPDGRVYFHWGFYRNHRQCGTFNAEPFILSREGAKVDIGES